MKLTIGNVTLDNNVILAPMAGVTDLPYRCLLYTSSCSETAHLEQEVHGYPGITETSRESAVLGSLRMKK